MTEPTTPAWRAGLSADPNADPDDIPDLIIEFIDDDNEPRQVTFDVLITTDLIATLAELTHDALADRNAGALARIAALDLPDHPPDNLQ